jgi:hypothetical protein
MCDAFVMSGLQSIGNLLGIVERRLDGQRTFECLARDQFHHQRAIFHSVNLGDVGMVECRQYLGLTLEARHARWIASEDIRQHFQRNLALQLGVLRSVHFTHAARAKQGEDLVRADSPPNQILAGFRGELLRRHFQRRRFEKTCPLLFRQK